MKISFNDEVKVKQAYFFDQYGCRCVTAYAINKQKTGLKISYFPQNIKPHNFTTTIQSA